MSIETIESRLLQLPFLGRLYRRNAAALKRRYCLQLHRLGRLKPDTFVQWLATNQCNLSCSFCESSSGTAGANELSREEVFRLIDELSSMGVARLVVSGGEPLLRPDICEIMAHANRRNLAVGLVSNGWHVADLQMPLSELRLFLYFTSLDGMPEYHDQARGRDKAFARAMQGLELFARMRVATRIVNTVVHPGNIGQLEGMVNLIKESGATSWRLTPVSNVGRAAGNSGYALDSAQLHCLSDFIRKYRRHVNVDFGESHTYMGCFTESGGGKPFFCGAGLTRCSITADGEVMGCQQIFDPAFSEGNIRDSSFRQIWQEGFNRFRNNDFPADCPDCPHFAGCQGGCWAEMQSRGSCLKTAWAVED